MRVRRHLLGIVLLALCVSNCRQKSAGEHPDDPDGSGAATSPPPKAAWSVPTTVASGLRHPENVVVDDAALYFTAEDSSECDAGQDASLVKIVRAPRQPGAAPTTLASCEDLRGALAADMDRVYWGARGAVVSVPKLGGRRNVVASASVSSNGIAIDSGKLYFAVHNATGREKGDHLVALPKGGDAPLTLTEEARYVTEIAVDDGFVYWVSESIDATAHDRGIHRIPKAGGSLESLVTDTHGVVHMAVDDSSVFYIASDDVSGSYGLGGASHSLYRIAKTGGVPSKLLRLPSDRGVTGLAVDGKYVYWTLDATRKSLSDGAVYALLKAGGQPVVVAERQSSARNVTVTGRTVAWIDWGTCPPETAGATGSACSFGYKNDGSAVFAMVAP